MKIKSNMIFNTSILARHTTPEKNGGGIVVGSGQPEYLKIPAGATISLSDVEWEKFNSASTQSLIKAGDLVLIEAPKVSAEVQEASDVELEASLREQMNGIIARRAAAEAEAEAADLAKSNPED